MASFEGKKDFSAEVQVSVHLIYKMISKSFTNFFIVGCSGRIPCFGAG
jgi:hypothetical protein